MLDSSKDLIDFFMGPEFLQTRANLLHLFRLSCLCITSQSPQYPVISLGRISTLGHQNRFSDVILPEPNFFANVPNSVPYFSDDQFEDQFTLLASDHGGSVFAADYDPWVRVDNFGRSSLYKVLLSSYKTESAVRLHIGDTSSVVDEAALKMPSKTKRKRQGRKATGSSTSSVVSEMAQSSSKT